MLYPAPLLTLPHPPPSPTHPPGANGARPACVRARLSPAAGDGGSDVAGGEVLGGTHSEDADDGLYNSDSDSARGNDNDGGDSGGDGPHVSSAASDWGCASPRTVDDNGESWSQDLLCSGCGADGGMILRQCAQCRTFMCSSCAEGEDEVEGGFEDAAGWTCAACALERQSGALGPPLRTGNAARG